jgi:hypothetical protein
LEYRGTIRIFQSLRSARRDSCCNRHHVAEFERASIMVKEEEVLAALDKPRALYSVQQRVDPANKSTDALQELLMRMRTEGKVKFDIKSGKWSKA